MKRISGRNFDEVRKVEIITDYIKYAEGSCLVSFGETKVVCTATVDHKVPFWMKNTKRGWISAEYGMLPRSTQSRVEREASKGKQTGRTQEIQRLIGRSLRAIARLDGFVDKHIKIDCDVIQADGGTRTAAITGSYVALYLAFRNMVDRNIIKEIPLAGEIAAVSCGVVNDNILLDLDYSEDSSAYVDANFVLTSRGAIVEIQSSAEIVPYSTDQFNKMFELAQKGVKDIIQVQRNAIMNSASFLVEA